MTMRTVFGLLTMTALAVGSTPQALHANDNKQSVTVSFGVGLNTLAAANHHVVPNVIKVRAGGVVNFVVGGFHQIFVYNPGVRPEDLIVPPFPGTLFINDFRNLYYQGINPSNAAAPAGANPLTPPENTTVRTNTQNRTEAVGFTTPGLYLVICNVNPHFRDGMIAWVRVLGDDEDDHDHDHDDHDDHGGHGGRH
jgi:plastocyanin